MKRNPAAQRLMKVMTLLLIASFADCSLRRDGKENKWKERPADFHVSYNWFSGSISPPYQYEYIIEIGPGSQGKMVLSPTQIYFAGDALPHWTETFPVNDEDIRQLYELMAKSGVFERRWKEDLKEERIGGQARGMRVEGDGRTISVPTAMKPVDEEAIRNVYDAIESLVPKPLRTKLESQRQRYIEDYNH